MNRKIILIVLLIVVAVSAVGYFIFFKKSTPYASQEECEQKTGKQCFLFKGLCQVWEAQNQSEAEANEKFLKDCLPKIGTWQPTETTSTTQAPTENGNAILTELQRLNIEVTGQPKKVELELPPTLSDANWGMKKIICEEGGYNLSAYAGKILLFTSYSISELWNNTEPLNVWVATSGNNIACVYKTVRENSNVVPGIFSVKKK